MLARQIASQTGPHADEASPMLQTTMPLRLFTFLKIAAPTEMSAEPPTMALFGYTPNGVKNACIEPPIPLFSPASRPNISASVP